MKILLMEDDLILNEIIEEHLLEKGHEVVSTFAGNEAEELLYSQKFDLLLLDVNVPEIRGFDLLSDLRKNNIKTPAIFLTSLNLTDDIERGFQSGCDDYIKKPFELKELDLRINNIKRIFNISSSNQIDLSNDMILDTDNLLVIKENEEIHLSKKEIEVLLYFIRNKNKIISVEELSSNVWVYEESPNASTIRTYIKNLRKILEDNMITNIRGVGYRFNSK
jgi:DNA-binding response OmpR family regulator|tara:strand:+ start:82301 stop:82963 length:663 start_codon:yes stop_codon:yes gene_type:complete